MLKQLTRGQFWAAKNRIKYCRRIHENFGGLTLIEKLVHDSIKASGPIPVSTYMQLCLSHHTEGYYSRMRLANHDVFGREGDFITSPEISQVFGELVSLWFLSIWNQPKIQVRYPTFRVIELGPGRGTLISDLLRTFSNWSSVRNAMTEIHLVETSPFMRSRQAVDITFPKNRLHWHDSVEDIPMAGDSEFSMVIAHEFFDALPINILQRTTTGFRELLVDVTEPTVNQVPTPTYSLKFVVSPEPTPRSELLARLSERYSSLSVGTRVEVSSTAWRIARRIGEIVGKHEQSAIPKGAALVVDYGDEHFFSSSLRAFKKHQITDVFDEPGRCDVTANVDFALLKEAVKNIAGAYGTMDQKTFLTRMGVAVRLEALLHAANQTRQTEIRSAVSRLLDTSGQGMGRAYKFLGIVGGPGQKKEVWPFVPLIRK